MNRSILLMIAPDVGENTVGDADFEMTDAGGLTAADAADGAGVDSAKAEPRSIGTRSTDRTRGTSSSSSSSPLWDLLSEKVAECGLTLFDLEVPTSMTGTIRVFLWRAPRRSVPESSAKTLSSTDTSSRESTPGAPTTEAPTAGALVQQGVTLDDCARVAKHLQAFMDSPEGASLGLSSDQWALEVSSPGINRTLKRAEHFDGACGERISVRFNPDVAQFVVQETSLNLQKRTKKNQSPAQRAERAEKLIATVKKKRVLQGPLVAAMPEHLEVQDDEGLLLVHIPRRAVVHARVDFLFDQR